MPFQSKILGFDSPKTVAPKIITKICPQLRKFSSAFSAPALGCPRYKMVCCAAGCIRYLTSIAGSVRTHELWWIDNGGDEGILWFPLFKTIWSLWQPRLLPSIPLSLDKNGVIGPPTWVKHRALNAPLLQACPTTPWGCD